MSSRKGNVVTAQDIIESAHQAAKTNGTGDESTVLAAIKYAFAKNKIGGDISYDPQESIALEGNSGPYLQYAHARACSILSKSNHERTQPENLDTGERLLARKIGEYSEVLVRATSELMPHHICTFLYELAQEFNHFYEHNRVIQDEREGVRLWLIEQYVITLKNGLNLLGITAPERM